MNEKLKSSPLARELEELFDLKNAKTREEKRLVYEANEAQRDIRLLTMMFRDGIPDLSIPINDDEFVRWNSRTQQLLYVANNTTQLLESMSRQIMIKVRPHLTQLVKQAKDFYVD